MLFQRLPFDFDFLSGLKMASNDRFMHLYTEQAPNAQRMALFVSEMAACLCRTSELARKPCQTIQTGTSILIKGPVYI